MILLFSMATEWSLYSGDKRYVRKFNTYLYSFKVRCTDKPSTATVTVENLLKILEAKLNDVKNEVSYVEGDKIRVVAQNPGFNSSISTKLSTHANFRKLLDHIEDIVSSSEDVHLDLTTFDIQIFKKLRGGGRCKIINLNENRFTKRSITQIKNTDSLCGARAIIVALSYHTNSLLGTELSKSKKKDLIKGRKLQTTLAKKLCDLLGGSYEEGFTLDDFKRAENLLDVQIKIICAESFNTIIYEGPDKSIKLYLYKNKSHFDVINNLKGFYAAHFYCERCDTPYQNKNGHRCKKAPLCTVCKKAKHDICTRDKILCNKCNRFCYNQECLPNHTSNCEVIYKCPNCNKLCDRNKYHICGTSLCRNCNKFVTTANHQCYMVRKNAKGGICTVPCICNECSDVINQGCRRDRKVPFICNEPCLCNGKSDVHIKRCSYNEKYIWFDYEAMQDTGVHIPNLIVAHDFK